MLRFILKRVLMIIPVIICVSFLIFFIMEQAAGDPVLMINPDATGETYEVLKKELGYDRPLVYRYGAYMVDMLRGDLGTSLTLKKPVWDVYMECLPATAMLALGAVIVSHLISIPLGIISAVKNGTIVDNTSMVLALLGLSMPNFWLGLLLIILFALKLRWFPSYTAAVTLKSLILPAITVGTGHTALLTRTTRSSMVDTIRKDYLRTARAKGVPERRVITKHALKNALIPIVTISGTQFAGILGGAVLTETVFAWPGVGRMIVYAIGYRDVPLATGFIVMTTILSSFVLLFVDILYAYIDPRIKAQYTRQRRKNTE